MHCLVHASFLECGSFRQVRRFFGTWASLTGDLGELPFVDVPGSVSLPELLPWGLLGGVEAPSDEVEQERTGYAFPQLFYVAGVLHIMNNISKAVSEELTTFERWFFQLRALVLLLGHRPCRERFVATCLMRGAGAVYRDAADHFKASLLEHRWNTTMDA
eukprot:10837141-Alexandrium_andersonii.AAC.1